MQVNLLNLWKLFFNIKLRSHLMDSMTFSKEEDMARLQAMALLLFNKLIKSKDTDLLKAAYEWAIKSNDRSLLIWANTEINSMFKIFLIICT